MTKTITTLRQAARHAMLLHVECRKCDHSGAFLASEVAQFVNPERGLQEIGFRCNACGAKDFHVRAAELDYDRKPNIMVWRPMRL